MPNRASPRPPSRIAALDAARALGVVAMVVGHTLDAVLAPAAREAPLIVAYWKARGFTAPLFLAAAGWAVTVSTRRRGDEGLAVVAGRFPRVALLLGIGYALRWPGWGIDLLRAGDRATWAHLLAFDALHAIAVSLFAASIVLGLRWSARGKVLAFAVLATLSVALGMSAPASPLDPTAIPEHPAAIALAQAVGGTSPFPLFPWAGYFFVGSILGLVGGDGTGRRAVRMALVGGALLLATAGTGVGERAAGDPVLFVYRSGAVLVVLAALSAVPRVAAARLAPLGRMSLYVYAFHVAFVYGWSTYTGLATRIGPTLSLPAALGAAALVFAASVAATVVIRYGLAAATVTRRRDARRFGAEGEPAPDVS